MAHDNNESMALADVYAEALLLAAAEQGQDDVVAADFGELIRYLDGDQAFEVFLTSDSVDDDPRRESLERIFRDRLSDLLLNLLQVLNNRRRLNLVRKVHRCVVLRMEAKRRQQEVVVETAMPLTDALRATISQRVGEQLGKEVILIEDVQPGLIGGVVIRVGDVQIDASVASGIRAMRRQLFERATEEIYGGRGYVVEA